MAAAAVVVMHHREEEERQKRFTQAGKGKCEPQRSTPGRRRRKTAPKRCLCRTVFVGMNRYIHHGYAQLSCEEGNWGMLR
eukprot:g9652.t1